MTLEEAQSKILELEEAVQAKDETITSLNILQEDNQKKLSDYESQISYIPIDWLPAQCHFDHKSCRVPL